VYVTLSELVMFAVTGLLMLPSGLMVMVPPDSALAGWRVKTNTSKPKNSEAITRLEAILLNFSAFLSRIKT